MTSWPRPPRPWTRLRTATAVGSGRSVGRSVVVRPPKTATQTKRFSRRPRPTERGRSFTLEQRTSFEHWTGAMRQAGRRSTLPTVGDETGKELANLYLRGVEEGYSGELMAENAQAILDILDVFGEDSVRTYLVGVLEGNEDAMEDELDEQAIREEHEEDGDDKE